MSDAFKDRVVALMPMLRGYAMALTRSSSDADDLVQDTLVRAWRYRSGFQPGTNLEAWLCAILRNCLYSTKTKHRRIVEDVDGRHAAQLSCQPDQEWRLRYSELLEALKLLSAETRDALLLVVGAGLTYEDAAQVCGCAVGTLKSRVHRARAHLAEITDPQMFGAA
jgi:RNA polymerase sigma-70 factor (ECF subfamily)